MAAHTWPEAGLIYCEKEDTWCAYTNTNNGSCDRSRCDIHDPDWIAAQEKIEQTMQANHLAEMEKAQKTKAELQQYIRTQTKTKLQIIENEIERKTRLMKYLYKYGKKQKAQLIELEIDRLTDEKNKESERRTP